MSLRKLSNLILCNHDTNKYHKYLKMVDKHVNLSYSTFREGLPEDYRLFDEARGVIANFVKKHNLKVDLFLKEALEDGKIYKRVDVGVRKGRLGLPYVKSIVYKRNGNDADLYYKYPALAKVSGVEQYKQKVKIPDVEMNVIHCEVPGADGKPLVTIHNIPIPEQDVNVTVYKNDIPVKVGEIVHHDNILRHVYRVIEKLSESFITKK